MSKNNRSDFKMEQYNDAKRVADERVPLAKTSPVLAGFLGFFGGGMIAFLSLAFTGSDPSEDAGILYIVGAICGMCCYLFYRSHEKEHASVMSRVLEGYDVSRKLEIQD